MKLTQPHPDGLDAVEIECTLQLTYEDNGEIHLWAIDVLGQQIDVMIMKDNILAGRKIPEGEFTRWVRYEAQKQGFKKRVEW